MTFGTLGDAAIINPRGPTRTEVPPEEMCDFVPMAAVREDGSIGAVDSRPYSEVMKGYTAFQDGDVLLAKITPCFENNKIALARTRSRFAFGSTEFHVIRPKVGVLDSKYLSYFLRQDRIRFLGESRMTGSAGQRRVPKSFVAELDIPLPSLKEQRRIAMILDKAEAIRLKRVQSLVFADEFIKSTFLEMFGDPITNPHNWPVVSVSELGDVQGGLQVSRKRDNLVFRRPYLRVANVYRDKLKLTEIKEIGLSDAEFLRSKLYKGDVLIVEGHGNPEEIGRTAVWDGSIDDCVHQNHLIRFRADSSIIKPEYFSRLMNSEGGRLQMKYAGRTTSGLNTISTRKVKEAKLPLPSIELQNRFELVLIHIKALQEKFLHGLALSEANFASASKRAFRGEL